MPWDWQIPRLVTAGASHSSAKETSEVRGGDLNRARPTLVLPELASLKREMSSR